MNRLNSTADEVNTLITAWWMGGQPDQYGNNKTGQRLGQYVFNNLNSDGPWPELFYEVSPDQAMYIIWCEIHGY